MLHRISEQLAVLVRAHRRLFVAMCAAIALALWGAVGATAWFIGSIVTGLPDESTLRGIGAMAQSTTLYDVKGRQAFTIFKEQRIEVPLDRVSPHLIDALLAIEDQRFFDHGGIDVIRVAGAAWMNVRAGWGSQGGSTITQQLARQSFLTRDKTIQRKLKEIVVAARLENEFSKQEILQLYLNKVYFGDGLHGVEAASLGYFGKNASDLTVAEAALLAGLVRSPSTTAPTVNMERAVARRNAVLRAMLSSGAIDQTTYDEALKTEVVLNDTLRGEEAYGQYFKEEVRKQLVEMFGWERVYEGGLRVYTTLDLDLQKAAEAEVARTLAEIERRQSRSRRNADGEPLQAALVALDPHTGEVRAMVGGRDYEQSRFNRAMQAKRQAGSAFKPFVYAAALERGYTPATVIRALETPIMTLQGAWVPDDHSTSSAMTMRAALRTSSNRIAVQTLQEIGVSAAVRSAERLGIPGMPAVPSLALGSGDVTLIDMTAAYAAFANEGMRPMPMLIKRVEDATGQVLYNASPRAERAVSEATAFLMSSMLSDVISGGTGWQARRVGFTLPAAGKTGTTNDYRDVWFVGYTPRLAAGVWIGYDQPRTIIGNGYAGDLAVPLWGRFMAAATKGHEREDFHRPSTVGTATICRLTGKLATDNCRHAVAVDDEGEVTSGSMVYTEYFVRGTEPEDYCDYHVSQNRLVVASTPSPALPGSDVLRATVGGGGAVAVVNPPPPAPAVATAEAGGKADDAEVERPQQRRRGFWSRVFGIGRRDSREPEKEEREEESAGEQQARPANAR